LTLNESNQNCLFNGSPAIHSALIEFKLFCGKNLDKMSLRILHTFLTAHMFAAIMLCLKPKGAERSDSVPVSAALYFLEFLVNANDLGSYFPQSNEAGPGPSLLRLGGAKCHGRRKSRIPGNEVRTYADGLVGSVFWAPQWLKPQTKLEDESFLNAKNFWHPAKWKWIVVAGCSPGPLFSRVYLSNFFHLNLS